MVYCSKNFSIYGVICKVSKVVWKKEEAGNENTHGTVQLSVICTQPETKIRTKMKKSNNKDDDGEPKNNETKKRTTKTNNRNNERCNKTENMKQIMKMKTKKKDEVIKDRD